MVCLFLLIVATPWAGTHQTLQGAFELICMTELNIKTIEYILLNIIFSIFLSKHYHTMWAFYGAKSQKCGQWRPQMFVLWWVSHLANMQTLPQHTKPFVSPLCHHNVLLSCIPSLSLQKLPKQVARWFKVFFYSFADTQTLLPFLQPAPDSLLGIPQFPVSPVSIQGL